MIKYFLHTLALFVLLVLQAGLISQTQLGNVGNLLMLYVIVVVILSPTKEGFIISMIAGLMTDFVSGTRDGTFIIAFLVVFGFTHLFINKIVPREPNRFILLTCVAINTILLSLALIIVNRILSIIHLDTLLDWQFILSKKLLFDIIANLVFAYIVYWFYSLTQKMQVKFR